MRSTPCKAKPPIEKPILRIVVGDVAASIAEIQSDVGRAAAAAGIRDESDAQVNCGRGESQCSRGEPGLTAQYQGVVTRVRLKLKHGSIANGAGETAVRRQTILLARQATLIKRGTSPRIEFESGSIGRTKEVLSITTSRLKPVTEMGVIFAAQPASGRHNAIGRVKYRRVNMRGEMK